MHDVALLASATCPIIVDQELDGEHLMSQIRRAVSLLRPQLLDCPTTILPTIFD